MCQYRLYKHKTISNSWKVVYDYDSHIPEYWMPMYTVTHSGDSVKYESL